ncbi:glycosyltransferase [Algibacter pacificus]|uniref:glycosyltransferase n=1 Tax=Algibacter pacificus TaxID=2599389 RepID=UPI0011C9CDE0|nr:glycosyltransferase [Algibacter pacificus]
MNKNKGIFIAWIKFQRRAFSMQPFFDFDLNFINTNIKKKKLKILDYLIKAIKTVKTLCFNKDKVIWIQLPPTPLLTILLIYKKIYKNKIIIADCHNGLFNKKWEKYLNKAKSLNKVDLIITHNHVIRDLAIEIGVDSNKLFVLETKPAYKNLKNVENYISKYNSPWILMPCGFAEDEPMSVVFEAARLIPEVTFVISGNKNRAEGIHDLTKAPSNINFTGYLTTEEYEGLFSSADAVLGLTTEHHVQLSVANEATGFEKPMILSDTKLLRELFNKGAVYVETLDSKSMSSGIKEAIRNKIELGKEVKILKEERNQKWENQALTIKKEINKLIVK